MDRLKVIFIELVWTVFVVLRDAGMVPVLVLDGACVFVPSELECSVGLAYVGGGVGACACVFVYSFFLMWVRLCLVVTA